MIGDDDVAGMLADFGESFQMGGTTLTAIFQNEYEVASVYGIDVDSSSPVVVCRSIDVDELDYTAQIVRVADGQLYYVTSIQSDGIGVTTQLPLGTGLTSLVVSKDQ